MNCYLNNIKKNYPDLIQNHAYASWTLNELIATDSYYLRSRIASLSGYPIMNRNVRSLDKNFLDSTYTSLYTLSEYDKKQSLWKDKQSTMISKVAKVQALREAFPSQLGAMYTQEEQTIQDTTFEDVTPSKEAQNIIAEQREKNQQQQIQALPSNPQSSTPQPQVNNNFENGGANPQTTQAQQQPQPPFKLQ